MSGKPRNFENKIVLITGGGSGVGLACARAFGAQGAGLLLVGRDFKKLENIAPDIDASFIAYLAGDVRDPETAVRAMDYARNELKGPVDVLVNNAGTILRAEAAKTSDEDWQFIMDVNVNGPFYFSREFAKQDISEGAIVNVSSTCGQVGAAGLAAYCASKGAVDQLTRSMALELAPRGITVNAVAPGAINSPMLFSNHTDKKMAETAIERNMGSIPIGSVAEPEDVARAILFLARERHITGTILSVDGGYTAQ